MTESVVVTAGWYPDPTGRHQYRYWQGNGWTDLVSDAGLTTNDPAVATSSPASSPQADPAPADHLAARMPWGPPSGPAVAAPPPAGVHPAPPAGAPAGPLVTAPVRGRRRRWWIVPVAVVGVLLLVAGVGAWVVWNRPGPSPEALRASTVTSTSASLTWSRPRTGKTPQHYVVQRDGVEIGRTDGDPSYLDTRLTALGDYRYRVLAVVGGRLSHPTAELVVRTLPQSPFGMISGRVTTTSVVVSWSAPPGPRPDSYVVQRDGGDLATVPAGALTYTDSSLRPLTEASYSVVAVTKGRRSDPAIPLRVTTPAPPISDARLQHSWDVTLTVSKAAGTRARVGQTDSGNWVFSPRCAAGACPVEVSGDIAGRPFSMTLNRSGAVYKGSGRARVARCGNTDITNNLALTVRVTDGGMSDGVWAASNWTGSLALSIPYTRTGGNYYCPAQTVTFTASPDSVTADQTT